MGYSLNLRVSSASAPVITALWDTVSAFEDAPSMRALDYPPHVTLAIYDDDAVSEQRACDAIKRAARGQPEFAVAFNRIRFFAGPPLVLWAAPEPEAALRRVHAAIHAAIDPGRCRSHYRPAFWTPHCTLGTRIRDDRRPNAMAFAEGFRGGLVVTFDVIDCMAFPPLRAIAEQRLASLV
jgi:2'-5' RNA ligase